MFGVENFYVASFTRHDLKLQGEFNRIVVLKAMRNKFEKNINEETGYLEMKQGIYNIILT